MWINTLWHRWYGRSRPLPSSLLRRRAARQRPSFRPHLEALEERALLSSGFVPDPTTAAQLVQDINYVNQHPGTQTNPKTYTIELNAPTTSPYVLTTALPTLAAAHTNLTINGHGDTIDGANAVRLFDVGGDASLTLENLTLTGGLDFGLAAQGGAIYSSGTLTLRNDTFRDNRAQGLIAQGGAIYSAGTLTLSKVAVESNEAIGSVSASGGGLYVASGSATLGSDTFSKNSALGADGLAGSGGGNGGGNGTIGGNGGTGGNGGSASGGGLYLASGSATLSNDTFATNRAQGGNGGIGGYGGSGGIGGNGGTGGNGGSASGGGLYLASGSATLNYDTFSKNRAQGGAGGNGGYGGTGTNVTFGSDGNGGNGGNAGNGGSASGGGLYMAGGSMTLGNDLLSNSSAQAGAGGLGGHGGLGGEGDSDESGGGDGGNGGKGGQGGDASGGSLAVAGGSMALSNDWLSGSQSQGGAGGGGGVAGTGGKGLSQSGSSQFGKSAGAIHSAGGGGNGGYGGEGGAGGYGWGGAVFESGSSTLTLSDDTVSGNTLQGGVGGNGGQGGQGGAAGISGPSTFSNGGGGLGRNGGNGSNGGSAAGAGLYVGTGSATLANDTFSGNNVQGGSGGNGGFGGQAGAGTRSRGGAPKSGNGGNGGNGGSSLGGGVYTSLGTLSLLNDTLSYNGAHAASPGSAGFGYSGGKSGSSGQTSGGGLYAGNPFLGGSNVSLANTLIAGNTAPTGKDAYGTVSASDHDFIGNSSGFAALISEDDLSNVAAKIGPLADNGGPRVGAAGARKEAPTIALLAGSPAIDAGDNAKVLSVTDQRGYARVVGNAVDIGAYEYGAVPVNAKTDLVVGGSVSSSAMYAGGQITYSLTVTNKGPTAQNDITLFDTLPADTTLQQPLTPVPGWHYEAPTANTLLAWNNSSSLAAGASVTFTFTVQINSGTTVSTILTDTASVGPLTGDRKPSNNGISIHAVVLGAPPVYLSPEYVDVSNFVPTPTGTPGEWAQRVRIAAVKGDEIGPLALVLSGLPSDVTLVNASGMYEGFPYVNVVTTGSLSPGHPIWITLYFKTKTPSDIDKYTSEVLQGL